MPKCTSSSLPGLSNHLLASIVAAKSQDCHQYHNPLTISHKALCEALLPLTIGWENFFLREILKLSCLTYTQVEKLEAIAKKCKDNEANLGVES